MNETIVERTSSELTGILDILAPCLEKPDCPIEQIWHFGSSLDKYHTANDIDVAIICQDSKYFSVVEHHILSHEESYRIQLDKDYTKPPSCTSLEKPLHIILTSNSEKSKTLPIRASINSGVCMWSSQTVD